MHPSDAGRLIAGRYRLQTPVGRGAMGVVWRARDQLLDRDVAVKEVHIAETLTDAERAQAYQRTLREAKTAARLNHPAVVTVYDVAEDQGRPWIVMQLVHAQSLDQVLAATGPLSPRRAAEMGRQLLAALSVAHAAGVLHRDVKPSNVLLGSDDRAVLTDFGIATFQGDPRLTQTGMVMGSPGFTAPERIRGDDASPASDLWSLGATLFAAVEGHGPFERRGGAITTMSAIINEDAPAAPGAGALGPVIAALLRREPADRPEAGAAERMITDVLPRLTGQTSDTPPGFEPTALSASSPPGPPGAAAPGPAPPGALSPGLAAATAATGPPGGVQVSADATAPTAPQVVHGDPAAYGPTRHEARGRPERPPPDFSSWYGPAAPPGAAPPPGSGSAYPPPAGYGPAAQAQGPPAAPPWPGAASAPSRRRRSGLGWKAVVVVLAIIGAAAGAATVVLLHQSQSGSPQGQGTSSAPATATGSSGGALPPSTLQIIDAVNQRATGPLPSGFTLTSRPAAASETAGFSIAAPASWQKSASGHQTYLKDPADPNTNILIDLTPHTYSGMLREARYIESRSGPRFPGYHRVGMAALNIRSAPGAWWKFTWDNKGVQQEALDLLFVAQTRAGPQSYALYMTAPVSKFDQTRPIFDEEVETFATQPA
jgi:eukaryotic-like serine/threonine-protein kinase